jgi:hypothetical protein
VIEAPCILEDAVDPSSATSFDSSRAHASPAAVGVLAVAGLALAVGALRHGHAVRQRPRLDGRASLIAYLKEHLAGSDVAIEIVERLRRTHAGSAEGRLFASLYEDFQEERRVVYVLLANLGATGFSTGRLAAQAATAMGRTLSDGDGDFALFHTLEALAIGVQGKRCLWRALQPIEMSLPLPGPRTIAGLESMAVRQWEAIEERRRALVPYAFAAVR